MSVLDTVLPAATPPPVPKRRTGGTDVRAAAAATAAPGGVKAICYGAAMVGLGKDFADEPDGNEAVVERSRRVTGSTNTARPTA